MSIQQTAMWRKTRYGLLKCIDTVLSKQFRVQEMGRDVVQQWFLDKGAFGPPVLSEGSTKGLVQELKNELIDPVGNQLLKIERYYNGGDHICTYELLAMDRCNVVIRREKDSSTSEVYTAEAMSNMLAECFGKD